MNFTAMQDRLRRELLRRIGRGTLSVSLLARQTGLCEAHVSNFLRSRRQLSLRAMDFVLHAQSIEAYHLAIDSNHSKPHTAQEVEPVPVISTRWRWTICTFPAGPIRSGSMCLEACCLARAPTLRCGKERGSDG